MTALGVVEAFDQLYDGALAAAATAHQRHRPAPLHLHVDAPQHGDVGTGGVVEVNLLTLHLTPHVILKQTTCP